MDNFDKNIRYELTDISEQEVLAVFTLMNMLKRKREAAMLKLPIQNIITTDNCEMEINNETSKKKRRCHSLQDVTMFRKNEPIFLINDMNKPTSELTYEESYFDNDISSTNTPIILSCSTIDLIDDEKEKNDEDISGSTQSFCTSHSSIQQSVTSNTKLQEGVRELISLFDFANCYYRSSSSSHISINHFNKRNIEQEKQILTDYQTRGFDEEDMIYLQSSFYSLIKDHSLPNTLRWVDQSTSVNLFTSCLSDSCARTRPWTKQNMTSSSIIPCFSFDFYRSIDSNKSTINERNISTFIHKKQSCTNCIRQKRQTVNSNSNKQPLFNIHGSYQPHPLLAFNMKYRSDHLYIFKSSIHDFGVFTSEFIQLGELIIEYVGEIIRSTVADLREHSSLDDNYMFRIDRDTIINASRFGNISRFLNHSCSPNCSAKIIHKNKTNVDTRHIVIYAKRTIHPHEELTYDYKYDKTSRKLKCLCHSENCSGYI